MDKNEKKKNTQETSQQDVIFPLEDIEKQEKKN